MTKQSPEKTAGKEKTSTCPSLHYENGCAKINRILEIYAHMPDKLARLQPFPARCAQIFQKMKDVKMKFSKEITKLDTLSPLKTLSRGYCIAQIDNKIVSKVQDLEKDMEIDLRFKDGGAKAKII